ncbi:putative protein OS=Streptomyces microflavus OX=1919 GN=Smic_17650 PE=4 SV=1 [Streptomyces microflavus]
MWTAIIVFVLAVVYIVISAKLRPGREEIVEPDKDAEAAKKDDADGTDATEKDGDPLKKDTADTETPGTPAEDTAAESAAPEAADKS